MCYFYCILIEFILRVIFFEFVNVCIKICIYSLNVIIYGYMYNFVVLFMILGQYVDKNMINKI